jgi:cytochrome c
MRTVLFAAVAALTALPALADGDPAAGEKEFNKCKSCHSIIAADGTEIVKGGKTGPNLYGVIGRPAASYEGFDYGSGIIEARDKGLVWDVAQVQAYLEDPTKFLKEFTDDKKAKSNMAF